MIAQEVLRNVGNGFLIYAAVIGLLSVVLHARVYWWHTQMGRHLMVYMFMLDATLVLGVIRIVIGQHWWFEIFRLVSFIGVCLAMTQRVWLQLKAQREIRGGGHLADHEHAGQMYDDHGSPPDLAEKYLRKEEGQQDKHFLAVEDERGPQT